ncbi:MAG: hypothetical protein WC806_02705 [Candidatus Gracilibacteria bacterium]|jgi:hypothetical protein
MSKIKIKKSVKKILKILIFSVFLFFAIHQILTLISFGALSDHFRAFAVEGDPTPESTKMMEMFLTMETFFKTLLWPVLMMVGNLMDNSLIFGTGMEARLREIWIPIRNIVNIAFVLVLLGVALYNIIGGFGDEGGSYAIKAMLPKVIIGIIAVNFSFLGIKVALDATNILTAAILALPADIGAPVQGIANDDKGRFCAQFSGINYHTYYDDKEKPDTKGRTVDQIQQSSAMTILAGKYGVDVSALLKKDNIVTKDGVATLINDQAKKTAFEADAKKWTDNRLCKGLTLTDDGESFLGTLSQSNIAMLLAINMGKTLLYQEVDANMLVTSEGISGILVNLLFGVIMYFVYAASFIALGAVLLARIIFMWIAVALSPVLFLTWTVPVVKEKLSAFNDLSEKFVKHLIAPIPIAFSLVIGWIMLSALKSANSLGLENNPGSGIEFQQGFPVVGLSTLQDVIISIATVAIVWTGVFKSAEGTLAEGIIGTMKSQLEGLGKWVAAAPFKYVPWIPITHGDVTQPYALGDLFEGAQMMRNDMEQARINRARELFGGVSLQVSEIRDTDSADVVFSKLKHASILEKLKNGTTEMMAKLDEFKGNQLLWESMKNNSNSSIKPLLEKYKNATDEKVKQNIMKQLANKIEYDPNIKAYNIAKPEAPKVKEAFLNGTDSALIKGNGKQTPATILGKLKKNDKKALYEGDTLKTDLEELLGPVDSNYSKFKVQLNKALNGVSAKKKSAIIAAIDAQLGVVEGAEGKAEKGFAKLFQPAAAEAGSAMKMKENTAGSLLKLASLNAQGFKVYKDKTNKFYIKDPTANGKSYVKDGDNLKEETIPSDAKEYGEYNKDKKVEVNENINKDEVKDAGFEVATLEPVAPAAGATDLSGESALPVEEGSAFASLDQPAANQQANPATPPLGDNIEPPAGPNPPEPPSVA